MYLVINNVASYTIGRYEKNNLLILFVKYIVLT